MIKYKVTEIIRVTVTSKIITLTNIRGEFLLTRLKRVKKFTATLVIKDTHIYILYSIKLKII